jgi:hypothetical protein
MADDRTPERPVPNPWDRELVIDARSRDRRPGKGGELPRRESESATPGEPPGYDDAGPGTPFYGTVQPVRRREPHKVFLLAPWAGVIALCCACVGAIGPWLLSYDYSTLLFAADCAAVVFGLYAVLGARQGAGRMDFAAGALVLGIIGIALWFWVGRPAPLLTPT